MIDFVRHQNELLSNVENPKSLEALQKKAFSLNRKGDVLFIENWFTLARGQYQKSLEAYREAGDSQGIALCCARLGRVAEITGDYAEARRAYQESLEIFKNLSDLQGIARAHAHLGNLGWATGDYHEAANYLQEALSLYKVAEDFSGEAWVYDLMGNLYLAMREDEMAENCYRKAFSFVETLGANVENNAWNNFHLGALALFREQFDEAKDYFTEALESFQKLKDNLGQVATYIHLGEIACCQKDAALAEKCLVKAARGVLPTGCKPLIADLLTRMAQLLKLQKDERKAISILMVTLSHPTCRQQTKDQMVSLAASLEAKFSPKEVKEGFNWAKNVNLDEMADSLAKSFAPKPKPRK